VQRAADVHAGEDREHDVPLGKLEVPGHLDGSEEVPDPRDPHEGKLLDDLSRHAACSQQGARIVFELAAPGLYGEQATRNWQSGYDWWDGECQELFSKYAREHGIWIAVATQAGRTVDEDFPVGGYLFEPDGERVFATADWSEGVEYLQVNLKPVSEKIRGE
jgi:hypothetical protein